jgi:hypothetical protein
MYGNASIQTWREMRNLFDFLGAEICYFLKKSVDEADLDSLAGGK